MKKLKSFICMLVLMCSAICLYACKGNDDKATLTSASTNLKAFYYITESIDWTNVKVTAKYSDKSTKELTKGQFDIPVEEANPDTEWVLHTDGLKGQTAGDLAQKEYSLTLYIVGNETSYPFTITVDENESHALELDQFALPSNIQLFNEHITDSETKFLALKESGHQTKYYVGNDNPFVITPEYTVYKIGTDDDVLVDIKLDVKVYEGSTEVGSNVYTYADGEIKFDDSIIDRTFTIKIKPKYFDYDRDGYPIETLSFDVTVKDGYNVDSALDLGILSIAPSDATVNDYRHVNSSDIFYNPNASGKDRLYSKNNSQLWTDFLKSKGYADSELIYTKGIFLHGNINITSDDIPSDFLYTDPDEYPSDSWHMGKLRDYSYVYVHLMKDDFNFEGNYFTLDASQVPVNGDYDKTIIKTDEKGEGHNFGHSKLFYFAGLSTTYDNKIIDYNRNNQRILNMQNINAIGNTNDAISTSNSEHEADQYAAAGGLIMFTNGGCGANVDNVNISAAMIGYFIKATEQANTNIGINAQETSLNRVNIRNCFNCGIFDWGGQGGLDITNSEMENFGGPAIFVISKKNSDGSEELGSYVTYDEYTDQHIKSYIGGNEAWFNVTDGANVAVMQMSVFDTMVQGYGKTFYTDVIDANGGSESKFNFKVIIMDEKIFGSSCKKLYASVNQYSIKLPDGSMYPATQYGLPFFWTNFDVAEGIHDQGFLIPANSFEADASGTKNNPAMVIDPTNFTGTNFGSCIRDSQSAPLTGDEMCLVLPAGDNGIMAAIVEMYNYPATPAE